MEQKTLGAQGLTVSTIGYGAMGTAVGYGVRDEAESVSAIRCAREAGVTLFDTAEMYGWGEGERLLGRAVAPFRDEIVIATKFGLTPEFGTDSRPAHIREVVDASLTNLGVDCIDLLYQHRLDPAVPIEDVVGAMADLVAAGKVRYLGLSEATPEAIRAAHAVHPISALQSEYSLFAPDAEPLFSVLTELGIGFVAYAPLARGFLTGTARPAHEYARDDFRAHMAWWSGENYAANTAIVAGLAELAQERGVSVSQLALAWTFSRHEFVVPIPGSRNPERVARNCAAADLRLTAVDLERIARIVSHGAHGDRGTPSPWL